MSDIFTKQYLLESIKKANEAIADSRFKLPESYKSLQKYERLGIIPLPRTTNGIGSASKWRLYTQEEVDMIITKLKDYKRSLGKHE